MKYSEDVIDHARNPLNRGDLAKATHSCLRANASCGDVVEFFLKVSEGVVREAKWVGDGCALSVATASILSERLTGMRVDEFLGKNDEGWVEELMGEINAGRVKCVLLPIESAREALLSGV